MNQRRADTSNPLDRHHPALSDSRPRFIDNSEGNHLARALAQHLRALRQEQGLPWGLSIASAFFDLPGFTLIADDVEHLAKVRLLLGAEPPPEATWRAPAPGAASRRGTTREAVAEALLQLDVGLRHSRDMLPFDAATNAGVERLLDCLRTGKVEVRRYELGYLHGRAFIFHVAGGGLLVGSSNWSEAGLGGQPGLTLGHYEDLVVARMEDWFDALWQQAAPYDLGALYERLTADFPPYLIYLAVLNQIYGGELGEEDVEAGAIPVTQFQKHGVWRALRILKKYGGVLIADGVGLGKTFMAGEIMRRYRERRQRILLICPAVLRDSTWKDFLERYQLFVKCVSYEELARDRQLGEGHGDSLHTPLQEFALVVVDEAQNYRNPSAPARAGVLRNLLSGPRRDLVLLSATPVNNSLWDLFQLLRYFIKQDAVLAEHGVLSINERFRDAMREDPFNLSPDLLYPIIDATTVKRTRQFIKRHYENELVNLGDGRPVPIIFPRPVPSSINYDLDATLPGFLDRLEEALMPPSGPPLLTLARYQPENYPAGQKPGDLDQTIVGLIRSGLLKRFESSVHAFAQTAGKMAREHDLFLRGLAEGMVLRKSLIRELSAADDDDEIQELLETTGDADRASAYNAGRLQKDVRADRDLLASFHRETQAIGPETDPKLAALALELARIVTAADREGVDEEDRRRMRKVLIFSAFEDTVNWVEGFVKAHCQSDKKLACYCGRIASVAGNDARHGVSRDKAVHGFAPTSAGAPPARPGEERDKVDVLICTDVLAEGMNLQECRNVINYDLPWNPMRLVQRHGRIDRIGSPHARVFLRTFFPDQQLDRLLALEGRVRRKLAQAAASVGVEVPPIEHGAHREQSFAETRDEIERLHRNDPTLYEAGGPAGTAQSGEEYRQDLRRGLIKWGDQVRDLPWKAGSGLARGRERGHFFCARVGERIYLRFVPLGSPGPIVHEIGTCLRMIQCQEDTPRVVPADLQQEAFGAWQRARQDIFDSWARETDPRNLHPSVPKLNRQIAAFLRGQAPRGVEQVRLERALEAVEAPLARREENALRAVFDAESDTPEAKGRALIEEIEHLGLEPFQAPAPLPPIGMDEIHLVCWLAIEKAGEGRAGPGG